MHGSHPKDRRLAMLAYASQREQLRIADDDVYDPLPGSTRRATAKAVELIGAAGAFSLRARISKKSDQIIAEDHEGSAGIDLSQPGAEPIPNGSWMNSKEFTNIGDRITEFAPNPSMIKTTLAP